MLPSPRIRGLGLRSQILSRPPLGSLALRPGDSLTIPKMALSVGFIRFVSSTDASQATKAPDFSSGGTYAHRTSVTCLDTSTTAKSVLVGTVDVATAPAYAS